MDESMTIHIAPILIVCAVLAVGVCVRWMR